MTGDYHGDCALCTILGGAILFLVQRFGWPWMLPIIEAMLKAKALPPAPTNPVVDLKPPTVEKLNDTKEIPTPPKEPL